MNKIPEAPLNRLVKILKEIEFLLGEIVISEIETSNVNSKEIRLQVLKAKQSITAVNDTLEETQRRAYEAAYGRGTWPTTGTVSSQKMPFDNQQKISRIRELKSTLEQIETELAQG